MEKVVAVCATLIRESGSGLDKIFHDLLRAQGAVYRRCSGFQRHEGGGLSADIRGEHILVGSASFMALMEVSLPQGLNVRNAVFCAIDGELAGIFALNYVLHGTISPAISALVGADVSPVLCTRDFNLIPAMLRQKFKLPVEKMDFPLWSAAPSSPIRTRRTVPASRRCCAGRGWAPFPKPWWGPSG
ncbi:MAG: hypothetical protein ACLSAF_04795 [Intestinimonas sp.]